MLLSMPCSLIRVSANSFTWKEDLSLSKSRNSVLRALSASDLGAEKGSAAADLMWLLVHLSLPYFKTWTVDSEWCRFNSGGNVLSRGWEQTLLMNPPKLSAAFFSCPGQRSPPCAERLVPSSPFSSRHQGSHKSPRNDSKFRKLSEQAWNSVLFLPVVCTEWDQNFLGISGSPSSVCPQFLIQCFLQSLQNPNCPFSTWTSNWWWWWGFCTWLPESLQFDAYKAVLNLQFNFQQVTRVSSFSLDISCILNITICLRVICKIITNLHT